MTPRRHNEESRKKIRQQRVTVETERLGELCKTTGGQQTWMFKTESVLFNWTVLGGTS